MTVWFRRSILKGAGVSSGKEVSSKYQSFSSLSDKGWFRVAIGEGRWKKVWRRHIRSNGLC